MKWSLVGLLALACAHGERGAPDLEKLRADPQALQRARTVATARCGPGPAPDECCQAMMEQGDALWAAGDQEGAAQAYNRTRNRCPQFAPVRRHAFLLQHPGWRTSPAAADVDLEIHASLDLRLADDLRLAWYDVYLDGEPALDRVVRTTAGPHELQIELYIESRLKDQAPARVDAVQALEVDRMWAREPLAIATVEVLVKERPGAAITERVLVETRPTEVTSVVRILGHIQAPRASVPTPALSSGPPDPAVAKFLPPSVGWQQLLTPKTQLLPPELARQPTWGLFKVCVTADGDVDSVATIRSPGRASESEFAAAIRKWKHRPYSIRGVQVPYCYPVRLASGGR